ncbi:hypothetical protein B0H34DRAFT_648070 [Crassisporium funariophilum]|nr:hypothetical protein B0H34DRAFT_648070 [Crassisporium funariophilum]
MQPAYSNSSQLLHSSLFRRSSGYCLPYHVQRQQARSNHTSKTSKHSASSKLFADAEREEAEQLAAEASKPSRLPLLEKQHENWTGDESIQDAVLRMLVDKYKPLRTGTIRTADQKLKQAAPNLISTTAGVVSSTNPATFVPLKPSTGSWATEPLLPSSPDHRPWHTEFKVPSHDVSSVKVAQMPSPPRARPSSALPLDDRLHKIEREKRKRTQQAGRLTQARESTLDYRLGIKNARAVLGRPNPVSVKGWTSLIEDKIQKARKAGLFDTVKGRGQPLVRTTEEHNPFIAREEFLMNRIVQRNGAAPPWVEIQGELDTAVNTFREILRQSWMRRVIRGLTMEHPAEFLSRLTLENIKAFRDREWVKREQSYHDTAIAELNSHVRKYNGLAPYAVRRAYYSREVEIERLYNDCAEDILRMIAERSQVTRLPPRDFHGVDLTAGHMDGQKTKSENAERGENMSFLQWLRGIFRRWFGA